MTHEVRFVDKTADLDVIDARDPRGEGYDLQVFKKTAPQELDHAGLPKKSLDGGTVWVGVDREAGLSSIYYINAKGTAIRLASNSPSGHPASADELEALAPSITRAIEEAGGIK